MKQLKVMALILGCLAGAGGCIQKSELSFIDSISSGIELSPDFVPDPSDWLDEDRPRAGWSLGIPVVRGKGLNPIKGRYPVHLMRVNVEGVQNFPLEVNDLIFGVNGVSLGKDPENQFMSEVKSCLKKNRELVVTRWRKGKVHDVKIDLGFMKKENHIPDLTRGGKPDKTRDWTLGPIGVNAWGFSQRADDGASAKARQLLVTWVDEKGPALGKLKIGDVILGVSGEKFSEDARKVLAMAINEAEKHERKGRLDLLVWNESVERRVSLKLKTLGTYSRTAPYDCPKTEAIIEDAVSYMKENHEQLFKRGNWTRFFNGLGLLATGREDVLPLVRDLAHDSLLEEGKKLSVEKHGGMVAWNWAYKTLFLSEYFLITGDKKVLPTLEEYATKSSLGQSSAGTWGHGYAAKEFTGEYHGRLGGYGALNQTSLAFLIALPLVKKCGIENKEINHAIQRGRDFFSFFIGKGTIPYGDHGALPWYDDNGKSGAAAILFDILKNPEGTRFFSEMVLASSPSGREKGHTGHFWSHLWGGIGAARGGDRSLQVFMNEMNPIFTLERQHNGRFAFQNNVGEPGTQGKPKKGLDCTGARLLQLCYPRRILYLTGKETGRETHLTEKRIQALLESGRLKVDGEARKELTKKQLLGWLKDPLSPTRSFAVKEMEHRELNCVEELIAMLDSNDPHARYGAAEALGRVGFGNQKATRKLIGMMESDGDTLFRSYAVGAMTSSNPRLGLSAVAGPSIPVMLRMATQPAKDDPRWVLQSQISQALFRNLRGEDRRGLIPVHGIEGPDRERLVPAVRAILQNSNGASRSVMSKTIYPLLREDELQRLWGDIYRAARFIAPSGVMFAMGVRRDGVELLGQHRIEEGMDLAAWYLRWQKGFGKGNGIAQGLGAIENYGAHAKALVPYLKEHIEHFGGTPVLKKNRRPRSNGIAYKIRDLIQKIEMSSDAPDLYSISDQLRKKDIPPKYGP